MWETAGLAQFYENPGRGRPIRGAVTARNFLLRRVTVNRLPCGTYRSLA
jgi:hypothetical protein